MATEGHFELSGLLSFGVQIFSAAENHRAQIAAG